MSFSATVDVEILQKAYAEIRDLTAERNRLHKVALYVVLHSNDPHVVAYAERALAEGTKE